MSHTIDEVRQRRMDRQKWLNDILERQGYTHGLVAEFLDVALRTWREWVASGRFPEAKKEDILTALGVENAELVKRFSWR